MKKKKDEATIYTALALKRNDQGKHWAVVTLKIQNGKVVEETISSYDLLPYTLSKAQSLLQDMIGFIR